MMGRHILSSIILSLSVLLSATRAQGTGTVWSTLIGTDSSLADVFPEGFTGVVDPANAEQECKTWCLSIATCTMFLYYTNESGTCFIKTGSPTKVTYQVNGPDMPYNLVIRDSPCDVSLSLIQPFIEDTDVEPQCIETRGNTDDGDDEVPQGALNEPCLPDNSCLNGNVCDIFDDGSTVCKSPMNGVCRDISDCSYTTADPELECTLQGGTNDNRICAIVSRGDLNELCLADNTCLNGNVCDINADGSAICKAPLNGVCNVISDCSSTIADPDLECTQQGNSIEGICAIVPRGALNELCLADSTCSDGNVCDTLADGSSICKSFLNGFCSDLLDCSNTIADPDLACTLLGGTDDSRVCAIVAAAPPGASQVAQRRKRNTIKARIAAMLENRCPKRFIACPIQSGENFECVNPLEELANCGACGNDCQEIPGVHETGVSCSQGECLLHRCRKGYKRVGNECIARSRRLR